MQESFGVYKKIAHVMGAVGKVDKDAKHGQGFQYQSMEAVASALRGHMADAGLILLSECVGSNDTGSQWVCDYRFTFVDVEDGSNHSLSWQQATPHRDGKDDKAMGKNHTYAQKYFLLRTFMISSKDDVDADTNDVKGEQAFTPRQQAPRKQQNNSNQNGKKKQAGWLKNEVAIQSVKEGLAELLLSYTEEAIETARGVIDPGMDTYATPKAYLEALESQIQKAS